ncbi:MAG: SMC family ATPase [Acidobacteria bacterium]|nr:SMC family ATPase [Acidobacteriota bacterium]
MRPITLTVRAFGPYAGEQGFDFRQLNGRNLFLIHGPTGAGKTSILDAICFALYGETSGAERNAKHMRSDHADPMLLTEVTLDFSLGSELYRIYRRPEQERPKKRGEGTTVEKPVAILWRRTGLVDEVEAGAVLASQWSKVTEEIERLLGFQCDQFRQVVILPQGQFRRLLMADSREREGILEMLFQTEVYRQIEEALKETAKQHIERIKEWQSRRRLILEQAGAESTEDLAERRRVVESQSSETRARLEEFRHVEKQAQEDLSEGRRMADKIKEKTNAEAELKALEAQRDSFATKQNILSLARKAETLVKAESMLEQRVREAAQSDDKLTAARQKLQRAEAAKEGAKAALEREQARESEREQARQQLARLEEAAVKVSDLDQANQALAAATQEAIRRAGEREAAKRALEKCQAALEAKQKALVDVERMAMKIDVLRAAAEDARKRLNQRRRLEEIRKERLTASDTYKQVQARLEQVEQHLLQKRQALAELEAAWFQGQAAILAQGLVAGHPCPVCGSTEHPQPARSDRELPTEASLKEKREEIRQLDADRERVREEGLEQQKLIASVQSEARSLEEHLGEWADRSLDQVQAQVEEAESALAQAAQAVKQARALETEIQRLKEQETTIKLQQEPAEMRWQEATGHLEHARAIVMERAGAIPEHLRDRSALDRARKQAAETWRTLREAFEKAQHEATRTSVAWAACDAALTAVEEGAARAQERAEAQKREFAASLQAAGFDTEADFQSAKQSITEINRLEQEIQRFQVNLQAARQRVDHAQAAAEGLIAPDMQALEDAAEKARKDLEQCVSEQTRWLEQLRQIDKWLEGLSTVADELASLEKEYEVVGRIAEVANGRNAQGVTFQRFVLAALLDDVLIQASERLKIMSQGRFYLQRAMERADLRTAGGLELEVYDTHTGTARAVSTLSGGESFLASLSLALGLADVVQAYAGGVHLETMFVDEGFGSLDPEALEFAMRTLRDLQQSGRLVSIISHVPELKEHIDARLEVIAGKRGSVARFVV